MVTKSELELMQMLWSADEALTSNEIVEKSVDKSWKDGYVHIMIRSLLKKDLIKVDGFELVGKSYARKFVPAMSKEDYAVRMLEEEGLMTKSRVPQLFASFVDQTVDKEVLTELEKMIQDKKARLEDV